MSGHLYQFGEFQLNPAERVVLRNGEIVPLTPKAIQTLIVLVRRSGQVVSKDELIETVWKDTFVEENTLTRNISALRKTLGLSRDGQSFIKIPVKHGECR
jgi:DNA-binding winged helix-turn-helix (wHTH) protein